MSGRHTLAFLEAALAMACTPSPPAEPEPATAPAPVLVALPALAPPAPVRVSQPDPPPTPAADPGCPHRTLQASCLAFGGVDGYDEIEDCGEFQSGVMPDGDTRYHLVSRWWRDTQQAELLVLESKGCFTLIGDLGLNTLSTQTLSTKLKAIDLDDDGEKDEAVFKIVESITDTESAELLVSKVRTARYCRVNEGRWTCTEVLSKPPRAEDWPTANALAAEPE